MAIKGWLGLLLVILIISIPVFSHLDSVAVQKWDESRLDVSAIEMRANGNFLVVKYDGQPDMWSTKPPLLIWLKVLAIYILGPSDLAMRLPCALAAAATCLLLFWFFYKKYQLPWVGIITVLVLVTSQGFIDLHFARTGDYDAPLTFFLVAYCLFYYLYIEEGRAKYLNLFFVFLILAALTKGIAALMFLPALFIYTLIRRRFLTVLKARSFYIGIGAFVLFVIGYYLLREHYNPGYVKAVMNNELGGRFNTTIEGHVGDEWYYLNDMADFRFQYWYLLIVPGILVGIFSKSERLRWITAFMFTVAATFIVIISSAQTKITWYAMPAYPFLSAIVAIFIYSICILLFTNIKTDALLRYNIFPYVFLFLIFALPYYNIYKFVTGKPSFSGWQQHDENVGQFMKLVINNRRNIDGCIVVNNEGQNIDWYEKVLKFQKKPITFIHNFNFNDTDKVVLLNKNDIKYVDSVYNTSILQTYNDVMVYKLNGRKK